jgi:hypothetical protein
VRERESCGNFHGDLESFVKTAKYAERKDEAPFTFQLIFQEGSRQFGYESAGGNEAMHFHSNYATRNYVQIS